MYIYITYIFSAHASPVCDVRRASVETLHSCRTSSPQGPPEGFPLYTKFTGGFPLYKKCCLPPRFKKAPRPEPCSTSISSNFMHVKEP